MVDIKNPKDCCGCTACASICAHQAITMKPDVLGFLYPVVDVTKCVGCGLCDKICSFNDNYDVSLNLPSPDVYGVRHQDMSEIMKSRSGAMFAAISDYFIEHGGVVYGAGYEGHFKVVHKRAITKEERDEFRGSKYVQSDLKDVFLQVKSDLNSGMSVLFSGTPCQTSGLNSFVGKRFRENLLLVDIICHGTPAPFLWRDYLAYLEKKKNDVVCKVNFRDKVRFGWKAHHESFVFERDNDKTYTYTYTFYKHIMFRHSCGNCHFCNIKRPSDITLADFWHWQNIDKTFNADNKGANLVLVNTSKGREIFNAVKSQLNIIPVELEKCMQGNLRRPSPPHPQRQQFENYYAKYGFEKAMCRFGMMGWRHEMHIFVSKLKRIKRYFLRR